MDTGFLVALIAASASPAVAAQSEKTICEVGRQAVRDIPRLDRSPPNFERFYGERNANGIMSTCPGLKDRLPAPYKLATDLEYKRREEVISPHPVSIFFIGVPTIDATGTRAIFEAGYNCNGVCGASFRIVYLKNKKGWQMEGLPQVTSVS